MELEGENILENSVVVQLTVTGPPTFKMLNIWSCKTIILPLFVLL